MLFKRQKLLFIVSLEAVLQVLKVRNILFPSAVSKPLFSFCPLGH